MYTKPYVSPAITELGSLHERTLNWMVGGDGLGFSGLAGASRSSVRKFGGYNFGSSDDGDDGGVVYVKSGGSGGKKSSGSEHSGGAKEKSSDHHGFNVSDALKGFGDSH